MGTVGLPAYVTALGIVSLVLLPFLLCLRCCCHCMKCAPGASNELWIDKDGRHRFKVSLKSHATRHDPNSNHSLSVHIRDLTRILTRTGRRSTRTHSHNLLHTHKLSSTYTLPSMFCIDTEILCDGDKARLKIPCFWWRQRSAAATTT